MFIQQSTNQDCVLTYTRSFAERPSLGKRPDYLEIQRKRVSSGNEKARALSAIAATMEIYISFSSFIIAMAFIIESLRQAS
jgi:hypothetical protein